MVGWGGKRGRGGGDIGDMRGSCQGSTVTRPIMTSVSRRWCTQGVATSMILYLRLQSHQQPWSRCDRVEFQNRVF